MPGKIPIRLLEEILYRHLKRVDKELVLPPRIGEDAGAVAINDNRVLVIHSDPITAAGEKVGWLAIHIAANDIAATGAVPRWFTTVILLPENTNEEKIIEIVKDMRKALDELGASIVGGHTEYTPSVSSPIVIATAIGFQDRDRLVYTGGAREGDYLLLTKTVGIEATAVVAYEKECELKNKLTKDEIETAKTFLKKISIVREAMLLNNNIANSMHDPTEGGVIAAALEIAIASGKTIELWRDKVPIHPITKKILGLYNIDPLKSLSSGTLLATVPPDKIDEAKAVLDEIGVKATVIGVVRKEEEPVLVEVCGTEKIVYSEPPIDDLIKKLSL